jgi:flagellar biosynthesis/type III secretory pathway ATPase
MADVVDSEHLNIAGTLKDYMAVYRENEELINIGAYAPGSNEKIDRAIKLHEPLNGFLRQNRNEKNSFDESYSGLKELAKTVGVK